MVFRPVTRPDSEEWVRMRVAQGSGQPPASGSRSLGPRKRFFLKMASDAEMHNEVSQEAYSALGFEAVERQVCFRKTLV